MARLPTPGGDAGDWGEILNKFLEQSHTPTCGLKDNTVGTTSLQDGAVTDDKVSSGIAQSKIQDLISDLAAKVSTDDTRLTDDRTPTDASVTPTKLTGSPSVSSGNGVVWNGGAWIGIDLATQAELDAHINDTLAHPRELGYLVKQDGSFSSTTTFAYPTTGADVPGTTLTITKGARPILIRVKIGRLDNLSTGGTSVVTLLEDGVDVDTAVMDIGIAGKGTGVVLEYRSTVAPGVHTYTLRLSTSSGHTAVLAADLLLPLRMSVTEVAAS